MHSDSSCVQRLRRLACTLPLIVILFSIANIIRHWMRQFQQYGTLEKIPFLVFIVYFLNLPSHCESVKTDKIKSIHWQYSKTFPFPHPWRVSPANYAQEKAFRQVLLNLVSNFPWRFFYWSLDFANHLSRAIATLPQHTRDIDKCLIQTSGFRLIWIL